MKSIVFAILLFIVAVLASEEDVRCVTHSNDCDSCIKNNCAWCDEGFCIGRESEICPAEKRSTDSCSMKQELAPSVSSRATSGCYVLGCAACLENTQCQLCADKATQLSVCRPANESCAAADPHDPTFYASFYGVGGLTFTFVSGGSSDCVQPATIAPGSLLPVIVFTFILPTGLNIETWVETVILELFFSFKTQLAAANATSSITISELTILLINGLSVKRDGTYQTAFTITGSKAATTLQTLANAAGSNPSALPSSVGTLDYGLGHIDLNGNLVLATNSPAGTGSGSSSTVVVNRTITKSNHKKLTGGQLAGVIIGVFAGAVLLTLLIIFIIYKRRETYPLPFRSPAAAYRP